MKHVLKSATTGACKGLCVGTVAALSLCTLTLATAEYIRSSAESMCPNGVERDDRFSVCIVALLTNEMSQMLAASLVGKSLVAGVIGGPIIGATAGAAKGLYNFFSAPNVNAATPTTLALENK